MTPNPFMNFAALTDALSRLTALLVMVESDPEIDPARAAELYISQAVDAHAALVRAEGVIDQIGAFLLTLHPQTTEGAR